MSGAALHAAVFTAGALAGGTAAYLSTRRNASAGVAPPLTPPGRANTTPSRGASTEVSPVPIRPEVLKPAGLGDVSLFSPANLPVLKYGNPGPIADPLVRQAYVAAYDRRLRHPAWTAEHLTLASLGRSNIFVPSETTESGDRTKSTFKEDASLPASFRAKLSDYMRSGYDRGHMVPAADAKFSQSAMDEIFLLSNIAPQVGEGFNRHYWAYLEDWCRRLTGSFSDVYVFTIPLYLPKQGLDGKWRVSYEVIGSPPNIAVPTHFAKVVLATKPSSPSTPDLVEISQGAFVLPNAPIPDDTPLESFVIPVEAVEKAAGLTLVSETLLAQSKHICKTTRCQVVVRRFDEARKRPEHKRAISSPK